MQRFLFIIEHVAQRATRNFILLFSMHRYSSYVCVYACVCVASSVRVGALLISL